MASSAVPSGGADTSSRPAMYLTQPFHRALRERRDEICSVEGTRRRTWGEVAERIAKFAGLMRSLGLQPGDRVGILARNGDHYLEYFYGTMWAGGVVNPVNIRWLPGEMAYSLQDCRTRILIVEDMFAPMIEHIRAGAPAIEHVLHLGEARSEGGIGYQEALDAAEPVEDALRRGDDLAGILYTGGTTGRPKGVMLTHRSFLASAMSFAGSGECAPGPAMLHTAPLFHIGAISGVFTSVLRKSRQVFVTAFEPIAVMTAIAAERVTDVFFVPTMLQAVLDHPEFAHYDLSSLERISYGASPISAALMDKAIAVLPKIGFVQAYGMTELSPVATLLSPSDHGPEARASGRIRSAGQATISTEVRIVGSDGTELPIGQTGEIAVRGEVVMAGYWGLPEQTAGVIRDGWMHTGDLGRMDEHGYIYVVDRLKDMIVSGGENVFSVEVESALSTHPGVAQSAVIGIPHIRWGESVHAVIVPRDTANPPAPQALIAHCREQIAGYKCPRSFEFVEALPLSGAGKVLKVELRKNHLAANPQTRED